MRRAGSWMMMAALVTALASACSSTSDALPPSPPAPGDAIWPAPSNPLELTVKAGLQPETRESLEYHVHAHIDVFLDAHSVLVPAGIGINIGDPAVKHGQWNGQPAHGGIAGCSKPCISPLHTHDASGVLHTESATSVPNRLGQFFTEWDVVLSSTCVGQYCMPATAIAIFVNGQRYSGNPADIQLTDRKEIAVVIGKPPQEIPNSFPAWAPG